MINKSFDHLFNIILHLEQLRPHPYSTAIKASTIVHQASRDPKALYVLSHSFRCRTHITFESNLHFYPLFFGRRMAEAAWRREELSLKVP